LATSHLPMRKPPTLGTTHRRALRMTLPGPAVLQQATAIRPQPRLVSNLLPRRVALTHLARQVSAVWRGRSAVLECMCKTSTRLVCSEGMLMVRSTTAVLRTPVSTRELVARSPVAEQRPGSAVYGWTGTPTEQGTRVPRIL